MISDFIIIYYVVMKIILVWIFMVCWIILDSFQVEKIYMVVLFLILYLIIKLDKDK